MSRLFYHVMQDNLGNLLFGVSGTMRLAGTGTLATIYGDEALTIVLPNPMTNHPSFGSFKCFLGLGDYDFYMAKAGYTFETLTGVQGLGTMAYQNSGQVAITGGTVTGLASLGVGTPSPSQSLDVAGAARIQKLGINTAPDPFYSLAVNGDSIISPGGLQTDRLALNTAIDPAYRLAVNGPSLFTGVLSASNVAVTGGAVQGLTQLQATRLALNTAIDPAYQLAVSGPSIFTGVLSASNVAITGGAVQGLTQAQTTRLAINTAIDGVNQLQVNGPSIFTGTLTANSVAVTGGDATGMTTLQATRLALNTAIDGAYQLAVSGPIIQTGGSVQVQRLGINRAPAVDVQLHMDFVKASNYAIVFHPTDTDAGNPVVLFQNVVGAVVGSITTTGAATAYNTTSDARLKDAITPLTGALDVVRALNPVSFLWKADGTPGRGLLAGEVQEVIPDGVITGERGAIDNDGRILPQMIDYSKLVPYLVGAVKELTEQVETLTAQLAAAGA